MNVGELFIGLGIKGAEKTVGAITSVSKGLGEAKSMSLEAKAGILGAMYALERLVATSGAAGTGLTNFNAFTGLSARQLQQWQYAARQAGVSSEEFAGSVKSVQTAMTNMMMGKGAPEGLGLLSNKVGFDPKRARDTFYVLEQLQKFARTVPNDIGNSVMKSFGLSEGTIAAMRRNSFSPALMARAPIYSDKEINSLNQANVAWSNLGNKIEMAVGHFNAKHGMQLVQDITKITDAVLKLTESLIKMGEKFKIFDAVAKVMNFTADAIESKEGTVLGEKHLEKKVWNWMTGKGFQNSGAPGMMPMEQQIMPSVPFVPSVMPAQQQNINVKQDLYFQHDGKDAKKTGDSVKRAVQESYRQMSAQGQGS